MSKYTENSAIIPFSMICPGISQNTKHHHLTLYKGSVGREKSFHELCNHKVINIVYDPSALYEGDIIEHYGELYVPPEPGVGFIEDQTQIPWDSQILKSFTELANISFITFHSLDGYEETYEDATKLNAVTYQIKIGSFGFVVFPENTRLPPSRYVSMHIWTKEGLK